MPRWKALPDELDPQIREFTSQLRRLVDRSELSVASVADATGYSKTSWERYLNGRLLAPKGAIVALAEVTGTNPVHLTTMWELAERAWSRSEMRHDMTMEAIRISQARAALGEAGTSAGRAGKAEKAEKEKAEKEKAENEKLQKASKAGKPGKSGKGDKAADGAGSGRQSRSGRHAGGGPSSGVAGPAGVAPTLPPTVPAQPTAADSPDSALGPVRGGGAAGAPSVPPSDDPSPGGATDGNSWGLAGYRGPSPTGDRTARYGGRTGAGEPGGSAGATGPAAAPGRSFPNGHGPADPYGGHGPADPYGNPPADPYGHGHPAGDAYGRPSHGGPRPGGRPSGGGRRTTTFVAGVVGVLVVIAGAFFLLNDGGGKDDEGAKPSPSPTVSNSPELPPGVKCSGDACTGKDPEAMGCGGDLVATGATAAVGTASVEVRYSKICGAAWARVTQAAQGDEVQVKAGGADEQQAAVDVPGSTAAYTPMVAVDSAADATACVTLASGQQGCTQ
ncbi:DUF2690 domain-containing protein [Streptomyces sp. enrichment culture]|uniref:helix-turn-helix domain-containing protein n=1 Tax=Streptomyces sp. enrichment culture TaxID=1795815 RepID=UPI003F569263